MALHSRSSLGFRYEGLLYIPILLLTLIGIPGTIVSMRFYGKRIQKSSSSTALFLTSLAVFDMLSLVSNIPTAISIFYMDEWNEGNKESITRYFTRIPKYWSNLVLLLAGTERLIAVALPHKMATIFTRRVAIVSLIVVIIIAPMILVPLALDPPFVLVPTNGTITHVQRSVKTFIDPDVLKRLIQMVSVLYFGLPLVGVFISNICLVTLLFNRFNSKRGKSVRDTMTSKQVKELRTTKLVILVTVIFIVCMLPLVIMVPIISVERDAVSIRLMLIMRATSTLLETLNYSMNVYVYYFGSNDFRKETRGMLSSMCGCCKRATVTPMDD
ncbi:proteinase-activated receptor 2-like [Ylistrum balloti]|uniref:proteinase-activated receptor 2-like n=1 Tax=Ylistrum balloti TaxID=509963 RepID=UPI002905B749|nr:proteinase-activated receptor 2-like [Ylistrum balloti]